MVFGPAGGEEVSGHALIKPCFYKDVNGLLEQHMVPVGRIIGDILVLCKSGKFFGNIGRVGLLKEI